jgi:WD40 repeat protein
MQSSTRAGIARIDVMQQGRSISRGTGFLVSGGIVLTALHVVADRTKESLTPYPGELVLTFPTHTTRAVIDENYFDRMADWAFLRCETSPPHVRPLPLAELPGSGASWETFGFPDANPRDGMVNVGEVSNHLAMLEGNPTFQLFSREAAAGQGEPVKGLSGAPVLVENAVVGLLRFALMKDQQTVAGTLYACPIASVLQKTSALLPMPDPCFGLPGLPRQPLPAEPFRYLAWFTAKEAEVFFGRNREIRQTYERLTSDEAPPVTLLYGQSGVGKSSFLDAGLVPRLRWYHEVQYVRRDAGSSLVQTLCKVLRQVGGPDVTLADWQAIEEKARKPLIVFFDQIEEIYTRPNREHPKELEDLVAELKKVFESPRPPRGRVVLSFRKEWFPEIQKQMELADLSHGKLFLEGLDREAIVEVVAGLTQTERLRSLYGLTIEEGLPVAIANDLAADDDSPIAPTLQILLTKMWRKATATKRSAPEMTIELYQNLKEEGLLLGDFLDQQFEALKAKQAAWADSGLALDILAFHTTPLLTAKGRTHAELTAHYSHCQKEMPALLQEMQSLFLLSDTSGDNEQQSTRLSHDTLAPLVRQRFDHSEKPGQRARRILESRAEDWSEGSETGLLDTGSLKAVESGIAGMRALTSNEQTLIETSRQQQRKRQRNSLILRVTAVAAVIAIAATAFVAVLNNREAVKQKDEANLQLKITQVAQLLESDPGRAMVLALSAVGRSLAQRGEVIPAAQEVLNSALVRAREENLIETAPSNAEREGFVFQEGPALDWSSDGFIVTLGFPVMPVRVRVGDQSDAVVEIFTPFAKQPSARFPLRLEYDESPPFISPRVEFSPDGQLIAIWGRRGVRLMNPQGKAQGERFGPNGAEILAFAFTPDGKNIVTGSDDGFLRMWNLTGKKLWEVMATEDEGQIVTGKNGVEHRARVETVAIGQSPTRGTIIVTGGSDGTVRRWNLEGKSSAKRFEAHEYNLGSIAISTDRDGDFVIASSDMPGEAVRFWDQSESPAQISFQNHQVCGLKFSPNGEVLAVALADDATVRFMNRYGAEVLPPFYHRQLETCAAVAFDLSGEHAAVRTPNGNLHIVDMKRDNLIRTLRTREDVQLMRVRFSPIGNLVAAVAFQGQIYLWDTANPGADAMRKIEVNDEDPSNDSNLIALAFDSDGTRLASGGSTGPIRVWSVNGALLSEFGNPETTVSSLAFRSDGQLLSAEGSNTFGAVGPQPILWNWSSKQSRPLWPSPLPTFSLSSAGMGFSSGGKNIASIMADDSIQVWNLDGTPHGPAFKAGFPLSDLAFSADGTRIMGRDQKIGAIHSWALESKSDESSMKTTAPAAGIPDGFARVGDNIFISGPTISVWNASNGHRIADFRGHETESFSVSVSPDGKTLASAGLDGAVRLWRATWQDWREAVCQRLRQHPIMSDPKASAGLDPEDIRYARSTCEAK